MRVREVLHNVIDVQREEGAAQWASLWYPFLEALFCWYHSYLGGYRSVCEKVLYPSVHVAMYSCISHLYEETLPPDFVIGLFQINKYGNRVFVHLKSILNLLCESDQLVFCGIVTSEASLAWCDDVVVLLGCVTFSFTLTVTWSDRAWRAGRAGIRPPNWLATRGRWQ